MSVHHLLSTRSNSSSSSSGGMNKQDLERLQLDRANVAEFEILSTVGTGRYGRVHVVKFPRTNAVYALKICHRKDLNRSDTIRHTQWERAVQIQLNHPFIVRLYRTFQDTSNVYFLFEYVPGGEFFTVLRTYNVLNESSARFYAAQIVLIFEYLHSKNIVYRDLKPENLVMDQKGYVMMCDFGFAKQLDNKEGRTYTRCGTPEYRAPEILLNSGHGVMADWWTLGVLIYEMLCGYSPFNPTHDRNKMEVYSAILSGRVTFRTKVSIQARDLIERLLVSDPTNRLGAKGVEEIKRQAWFAGISFDQLLARKMPAPIHRRALKTPWDTSNFDRYSEIDESVTGIPLPSGPSSSKSHTADESSDDYESTDSTAEDPFADF